MLQKLISKLKFNCDTEKIKNSLSKNKKCLLYYIYFSDEKSVLKIKIMSKKNIFLNFFIEILKKIYLNLNHINNL